MRMKNYQSFCQILLISHSILSAPSNKDILFLELKVSLTKGKLSIDMHIKSNDCHGYLHYSCSSGHPEHTKQSIVYSQLSSVSWICFNENDFNRHKYNMKIYGF